MRTLFPLALLLCAAPAVADDPVWRVSLEVTADGEGLLTVKQTTDPPTIPEGKPLDLTTLPGTTAVDLGDGEVFLSHDLTRPGALERSFTKAEQATPRPGAGTAVRAGGTLLSQRGVETPCTVTFDIAEANVRQVKLRLLFLKPDDERGKTSPGWLEAVFGEHDGRRPAFTDGREIRFITSGGSGVKHPAVLVKSDRPADGPRGATHRFRVPRGELPAGSTFLVYLFAVGELPGGQDGTMTVRRFALQGDVGASLGVQLNEVGPTVLVKDVTAGGPAEAAGLQAGDILRTVGGETPRDLKHALKLLYAPPLGGTVEATVLRGPETVTATIRVE